MRLSETNPSAPIPDYLTTNHQNNGGFVYSSRVFLLSVFGTLGVAENTT